MNFFRINFEYTDKAEEPIHFRIKDAPENTENPPTQDQLSLLNLEITNLKSQLSSSNSQFQSLSADLKTLQAKCTSQASKISSLTSSLQQSEEKYSESEKALKKKLEKSEKINSAHFDLLEELKQKYQSDLKQKTEDLEKKILDLQKTLNLKTNQVFKLSKVLKDRENKRSSAEIILDELEKKNTEFIEKNAKNEKIIFDLEKRNNELNKRILSLTADSKSNDELLSQKDQQMKKLMAKIKSQEAEIHKLEEDLKAKDKKLKDLEKPGKNLRSSVEVKQGRNNKGEDPKRMLELLASKEEEVNMMKEMIKSFQVKHPSPSVSSSKFINSKLPPITTAASVKNLKSEVKPKDVFKVKTSFKVREISTKGDKKAFLASPSVAKSVGGNKFPQNKREIEESPIKSGRVNEVYEETPKFGEGTSQNFPDARVRSKENVIDENEEIGQIAGKIKVWEEGESFENNKEGKKEEIRKFEEDCEESGKLDEGESDSIDMGKNEGVGESKYVVENDDKNDIGKDNGGDGKKEGRVEGEEETVKAGAEEIKDVKTDEGVGVDGIEDEVKYQAEESKEKFENKGNEENKKDESGSREEQDKHPGAEDVAEANLIEDNEKEKGSKDNEEISNLPENLPPTEINHDEEHSPKLEPVSEKLEEPANNHLPQELSPDPFLSENSPNLDDLEQKF